MPRMYRPGQAQVLLTATPKPETLLARVYFFIALAQMDSVYSRRDAEAIGCSSDGRQERRALSDWDGSTCGEEYLSLIKGELINRLMQVAATRQ